MTTKYFGNFIFLKPYDKQLVRLGMLAEKYFSDDPNTCLVKLRQFSELLAQHLAARVNIDSENLSQNDLLRALSYQQGGIISRELLSLFHSIRKTGNDAVHHNESSYRLALNHLKYAKQLGIWFHKTFGDCHFKSGPFLPPPNPINETKSLNQDLEKLRQERDAQLKATEEVYQQAQQAEKKLQQAKQDSKLWEALATESEQAKKHLAKQLKQLQHQAAKQTKEQQQQISSNANKATATIELDEEATRALIDAQLRAKGWIVDTKKMTYALGERPEKGKFKAISEWETKGKTRADYILFDGLMPIAVIEAKRINLDVSGALEQAKRYSRDIEPHADIRLAEPQTSWKDYKIPFVFSSNARPFLAQLRTQSGIWFCDLRRPQNLAHPMDGWYTPEGLKELFKQNLDQADAKIDSIGFNFGFTPYPFQKKAIKAVEKAIKQGQQNILLAMATGTGKTKTCIALVYRLLAAQRFRRILFLVDRTSLGEQAADAFDTTRMKGLENFSDIFGIERIKKKTVETETKVHFATVQGMVQRLFYASDDPEKALSVDQYDCIVIDECHRGYLLDKELSDTELTFRNQTDYISKYSHVLNYFDAVRIGLTATPALHTAEIFGEAVFTYSYREAVLDNYLIDHEPPHIIRTERQQQGIHWKVGEEMERYSASTQTLEKSYAPDKIDFEISHFNKQVVSEPYNKIVCEQLAQHIDPHLSGKTLIFCATDKHADRVVDLLKQAMKAVYDNIEDNDIKKITGKSDQPLQRIREFKNENQPKIAVTVDLLTTGIDVPEITNIVFLRRVNSRILYEQMLGRATRKCDRIGKTVFQIYDAVDIYKNLETVSTMKPVVKNPNITYTTLIKELSEESDNDIRALAKEQFIAKFQRKLKHISEAGKIAFEAQTKMPPEKFVEFLKNSDLDKISKALSQAPELATLLDRKTKSGESWIYISHHEDQLIEVARGYGESEKPEDYLGSFATFIKENQNKIPALMTVLTRPAELTRKDLKALVLELEKHGFREQNLSVAWQATTNQDIAARIIGYIRQAALGDPLKPYEQRVDEAVQYVMAKHQFTPSQKTWLNKLANQMKANLVIDKEMLNQGYFKQQAGGYPRLNRVFKGELDSIMNELKIATFG